MSKSTSISIRIDEEELEKLKLLCNDLLSRVNHR